MNENSICSCGHWFEEHSNEGGCAGCDAGGQSVEVILHPYKAEQNMTTENISIDMEYAGEDDGGTLLIVLEDLIAKAVNEFRELYPEVTITINGVA